MVSRATCYYLCAMLLLTRCVRGFVIKSYWLKLAYLKNHRTLSLAHCVAHGVRIRCIRSKGVWGARKAVSRCYLKHFGCLSSFHFESFLLNKVRLPRIGARRASSFFFESVSVCVGPIHWFVHSIDAIERKIAFILPALAPHSFDW